MSRKAGAGAIRDQLGDAAGMATALSDWLATKARALPWRDRPAGERDGYAVLVSEAMLQQTQVSRVAERFGAFLARFPTVEALAAAGVDDVLAEWSGMGYYRRARNLHAAAQAIVREHGGMLPRDVGALRELPGVGRYTAGAIASLAFNVAAPIVDGNVARVLLRVRGKAFAADSREGTAWLWRKAEALAAASERPGVVNEAIMELGATVCLPSPATPLCGECPLRASCVARKEGRQAEIPPVRVRGGKKALYCGAVVVERERGGRAELLVEQRPGTGLWAGMWQAPTVEDGERPPTRDAVAAAVGLAGKSLAPDAAFEHQTTHRRVVFEVWRAAAGTEFVAARGLWMGLEDLSRVALGTPQRRMLLESVRGGTLFT